MNYDKAISSLMDILLQIPHDYGMSGESRMDVLYNKLIAQVRALRDSGVFGESAEKILDDMFERQENTLWVIESDKREIESLAKEHASKSKIEFVQREMHSLKVDLVLKIQDAIEDCIRDLKHHYVIDVFDVLREIGSAIRKAAEKQSFNDLIKVAEKGKKYKIISKYCDNLLKKLSGSRLSGAGLQQFILNQLFDEYQDVYEEVEQYGRVQQSMVGANLRLKKDLIYMLDDVSKTLQSFPGDEQQAFHMFVGIEEIFWKMRDDIPKNIMQEYQKLFDTVRQNRKEVFSCISKFEGIAKAHLIMLHDDLKKMNETQYMQQDEQQDVHLAGNFRDAVTKVVDLDKKGKQVKFKKDSGIDDR